MYIPGQGPTEDANIRMAGSKGDKEVHLKIQLRLFRAEQEIAQACSALIDTGAEAHWSQRAEVGGGSKEIMLQLGISGTLKESGRQVELKIPTYFYEADIKDDIILSYGWCRLRGVDISARHHGLLCIKSGQEVWIDGVRAKDFGKPETLVRIVDVETTKRALDLFSGTKSVSKVLKGWGYETITVDMDSRYQPDMCANILEWNYRQYPPGYFDIVTASPPCTEFSKAKTIGERKLALALEVVQKTLEIIQYFNPPT
ncbi:hypothetical protein M569_17581, partial [Genlisea aurea]